MSEQLPPLVSQESLRIITAAAQVGKVSPDVLSFLSASTEYHLLDVVNDAANFRARGKRSRLTVDDINASLELRGAESSLVFSGGVAALRDDGSTEAARTVVGADTKVDLRKVANASLPVCPIEPGFDMHWLAVDGQQPLLPQNPIPSSSSARGKGKGAKRGRTKQAEEAGAADGGSAVRARLSEELTTYLRRCCEAVLSRDEAKRGRALSSLRTDPGLQQLLPHLCTFIQTKVTEYLKRQKDPDQLATLLQMLKCLLNNSHFAFLEIYLDRLLPPVMSCLLYRDFARRGGAKERADGRSWTASSMRGAGTLSAAPPCKWTHWQVRDYAAGLLRSICDKHGNTYPTLQARTSNMFCTQIAKSKTPLTTLYGAIRGLACLGPLPVEQTLGSRVDSLTSRVSQACAASVSKRDTEGVLEADQCRLALLQAIGLSTIASTVGVFGVRDKPAAATSSSSVKTAPRSSAAASATAATAMTGSSSSSNGNINTNGTPATARPTSVATPIITSGGKNGSGATASMGGTSPIDTLSRSRLRKRLDRSLYSPGKPRRASQSVAGVGVASKAIGGRAGTGAGAGPAGASRSSGGELVGREGVSRWDAAGTGEGGGGSAFDEVVFPWYVLGLARDGARQGEWLTSRHGLFV